MAPRFRLPYTVQVPGTQQNIGQAIITLAAGDSLTLVNHTSAAAVTLQTLAGGTQVNVNASLVIKKLN